MTPFQKQYLFLFLLGFVALVFLLFVAYPSATAIIRENSELTALAEQIAANSRAASGELKSISEFNEQKEEVDAIYNRTIMTDENQIEFVRFMENLENEALRTQITFNPTERILFKRNPVTPFTIKTMSSMPEFINYLSDMEKSEYYILIHEIELKPLRLSAQPNITTRGTIEGFVYLE